MKKLVIHLLFFAGISHASAHEPAAVKPKLGLPLKHLTWIVGVSGIVVDDDGKPFKDLFNIKNSWSSLYAPSRITLEGALLKGWSAELSMAYSKLKAGKIIDDHDHRRPSDISLYTLDLNAKYYPVKLLPEFLSPYAIVGMGYTNKNYTVPNNGIMFNAGLGLSVWLYKGFGVNVQSIGKFAINVKASNYLMHSFGVLYRFKL
jgi:hypothetical protein